jgi:hypothetical protein
MDGLHEGRHIEMIALLFVFLLSAVAVFAVERLLRGSMEHPSSLEQVLLRLQPVNVASFRHLASEDDDGFLRENLPVHEYRRLRSHRLKAIQAYYLSAFRNSSVVLSYANLLLQSSNPELADFGRQLSSVALQLRIVLLQALTGIVVCRLTSAGIPRWRKVTELYDQIGSQLECFCASHAPDLRPAVAEYFSL